MTHLLRGVVLSLVLAGASLATTISFSGTGVFGSGDFSTVSSETTITGAVSIEIAGNDETSEEPNTSGLYSLLVGGIALDISGLGQFSFPTNTANVTFSVSDNPEGVDQVEVAVSSVSFGQVLITFFGDNSQNFVTSPIATNGFDAFNQINWANFDSGTVSLSTVISEPTGSIVAAAGPIDGVAFFTIDNVSNVPEPGTALVVVAGLAAVWMKRRKA